MEISRERYRLLYGPTTGDRIRLADTQTVVAVAEMSDGSFWSDRIDVLITLGACLEDP